MLEVDNFVSELFGFAVCSVDESDIFVELFMETIGIVYG